MKLIRTIKLRLNEDPKVFQSTISAYTKAFNHTCQVGWNDKTHNGEPYARHFQWIEQSPPLVGGVLEKILRLIKAVTGADKFNT